jgi:5'-deoxynucleotidase YfbR-like HD superfamily hydrolase
MNPFDRMFLLRRGGSVQRFHTEPFITNKQTVGQHTFGALLILMEVWPAHTPLPERVIRHLLYHDLGEQATGDVPAPVKWANKNLEKRLDAMEAEFLEDIGADCGDVTVAEATLTKFCDSLELCFTILDMAIAGVLDALGMIARIQPRFERSDYKAIMQQYPNAAELYYGWKRHADELYQQQIPVLRTLAVINAWEHNPAVAMARVRETSRLEPDEPPAAPKPTHNSRR